MDIIDHDLAALLITGMVTAMVAWLRYYLERGTKTQPPAQPPPAQPPPAPGGTV